jgi:hypothetical protein
MRDDSPASDPGEGVLGMTFREMVAQAISQAGGLNAATRALGFYSANSVSQWRDGRAIPELEDEERLQRLASLIKIPLDEVSAAVRVARRERVLTRQSKAGELPNRSFPPRKPLHAAASRLIRSRAVLA